MLAHMIFATRQGAIVLVAPSSRNFETLLFGRLGEENAINIEASGWTRPSLGMLAHIMVLESFERITRCRANVAESLTKSAAVGDQVLVKAHGKRFEGNFNVKLLLGKVLIFLV